MRATGAHPLVRVSSETTASVRSFFGGFLISVPGGMKEQAPHGTSRLISVCPFPWFCLHGEVKVGPASVFFFSS